jgi:hypothetical protein
MDLQTQLLLYVGFALSVGSTVIAVVNHKYVKSKCCGRKIEISLDIGNTTSQTLTPTP